MARMIPRQLSPEIKSNAERKIFEWFRDAPDTEDWWVLHSLGIANHRNLIYGEVDFLVLAPGLGVFALEVKGGRVSRSDGLWQFTDRYGNVNTKNRGPFEQARSGIFSVMNAVKKKSSTDSAVSRVLFGFGVMFPDIHFEARDVESEQWQVFDIRDGQNVASFIRRLSANCQRQWEAVNNSRAADKLPDHKDTKELFQLLRGDFDRTVSLARQIADAEQALITLTDEQLKCLDQLEDNARCLIQGAAGTGKTLLAIEDVKRSAAQGERAAFFCYNAQLGKWLHQYFAAMSDGATAPVYVGTFHNFMVETIRNANIPLEMPKENTRGFWQDTVPTVMLDALGAAPVWFDKIVIDEAQDLLVENYLEILDMVLKNGLDRGRWSMFGDFTRQAIFDTGEDPEAMKALLENRTAFVKFKLKVNCRNTRQIGDEIKKLTGFDTDEYLKINADGPPVKFYPWHDRDDQASKLEAVVKDLLKKERISADAITILSPLHREESVVSHLTIPIAFSTIRTFKGLENKVIILVDIDSYDDQKLMYVALSRARSLLLIFEKK